ncbi:MAG: hypothetical protein ACFFCV_19905 [Promethearchaeota archaeon]
MRNDVEQRLHRVMIKVDKNNIVCPKASNCLNAENCNRCNMFFHKCTIFTNFNTDSKYLKR